ncbi:hypothetical protein DFH28DRAFT_960877 [Melampsora americana]|nr:hypothetical protein DFH28DRAFT_960877 [Melampsora americana]
MPSIFKSKSNKSKLLTSTSIKPSTSTTSTHPTFNQIHSNPILNPTPAFTLASSNNHSTILSNSSSAHQLSHHSTDQSQELQLLYGYTGLYTQIELDLLTTSQLIKLISNQLKSRPLDSPLLFSSHALDLSIDSTHSLIRSFVNRHHSHFLRDLQISTPHNISAFLKWVLARFLNPQSSQHGFLNWSSYLIWRQTENDSNYPPDSITTQLFNTLPTSSAEILITLLDLFSSVAAYSHLNGITIHKCGAIFGAFIFGLEDDLPFEQTYSNWLRYSHATEHMILAYLRDQKFKSTTGEIASRLESCIRSYPKVIPSLTSTHPSAKLESVSRFRRNHLLNLNSEQELEGLDDNEVEIDLETQRFKSLDLNETGSETEKKLEFDLDESEKQRRRQRRETMDWDSFAGNGFAGRETFTSKELLFNTNVSNKVNNWSIEEKDISKKLSKTNKILPPFPYDIEPIELPKILVDDNFFEAWVDALISSVGHLIQYKSKFNTPSPKSIPTNSFGNNDTRFDEMWVLFEEVVPEEYRMMLMKNGSDKSNVKRTRRISFLKAVITRSHKDHHKKPGPSDSQVSTSHHKPPSALGKITLTPELPSSSSFSDVGSMRSYTSSQHPSERTLDPNRTTTGTGFMAELRARAKKRQQNYNLGTHSTHSIVDQNQYQPSLRSEEWINVQTDQDSNPIPSRPHHPTPPSLLSNSRSVTPTADPSSPGLAGVGSGTTAPKRRVLPDRKESLVYSLHSSSPSQCSLNQLDHRNSSSVRSGEVEEDEEKKSYGTMTPKKERIIPYNTERGLKDDYPSSESIDDTVEIQEIQKLSVIPRKSGNLIGSTSGSKIVFPNTNSTNQKSEFSPQRSIPVPKTLNSTLMQGSISHSHQNLNSSQGSSNSLSPTRNLNHGMKGILTIQTHLLHLNSPIPNLTTTQPNRYLTPKKSTEERKLTLDSKRSNTPSSNTSTPCSTNSIEESRRKIEELKLRLRSKPNQSLLHSKYDSEFNSTHHHSGINKTVEIVKPIQVFEKSKIQKVSKIVDIPNPKQSVHQTLNSQAIHSNPKLEKLMKDDQEEEKEKKMDLVLSAIPVRQFKLSRVGEE